MASTPFMVRADATQDHKSSSTVLTFRKVRRRSQCIVEDVDDHHDAIASELHDEPASSNLSNISNLGAQERKLPTASSTSAEARDEPPKPSSPKNHRTLATRPLGVWSTAAARSVHKKKKQRNIEPAGEVRDVVALSVASQSSHECNRLETSKFAHDRLSLSCLVRHQIVTRPCRMCNSTNELKVRPHAG